MCHTKASLRLPLINPSPPLMSASAFLSGDDHDEENSDEDFRKESSEENAALPTPSCTGSMDSLSSSSCSDRQMVSFTTFGKVTPQSSVEEKERPEVHNGEHGEEEAVNAELKLTNERDPTPVTGAVLGATESRDALLDKCRHQGNRISDSTDEDSGIENISRKIN